MDLQSILVKYCVDNYWITSKLIKKDISNKNFIEYTKLISKNENEIYIEVYRYKNKPFYIKQENYIDKYIYINENDVFINKK